MPSATASPYLSADELESRLANDASLRSARVGRSPHSLGAQPLPHVLSGNDATNAAKIKASFDTHGYVCLRGFLSPEEVAHVAAHVEAFIKTKVSTGVYPATEAYYDDPSLPASLKQLQRLHEHSPVFRELFDGKVKKAVAAALGSEVRGENMQFFNKTSGISKPTPPHQDGYYFMIKPQRAATCWLALDAADEKNGAMVYVQGSHKEGIRPHHKSGVLGFSQALLTYGEDRDTNREMTMRARPGDLIMHSSLLVHMAGANTSVPARRRRALGFIYYQADVVIDASYRDYQEKLRAERIAAGKIGTTPQ